MNSIGSSPDAFPEGVTLRAGRREDADALRGLIFPILRSYGLSPAPEGTDTDLADVELHYAAKGGWFAVLTDEAGTVVGSVGLAPIRSGVFELRKMYLRADRRGRGLGRALLERALAEARRREAVRLTLETASVLKEALALYERQGFRRSPFAPHVCRCDLALELELPFEREHKGYTVSTDLKRFDLRRLHALLAGSYWAAGIPEEMMARSLAQSLCFGLFHGPAQVGLARVVTDRATFGYLCDVIIDEAHRGAGLGRWLIEGVLAHPELQGLRRFQLVTRDMQPLYLPFGFKGLAFPERHLEMTRPNPYLAPNATVG